jgi:flagellar biosynthetic protein FliR
MIGNFLWPFVRIAAAVMVMPVLGGSFTPARVKILLALALTIVIAPVLPPAPPLELLSLDGLMMLGRELLIGLAIGFVVQLVFDAIALGGQVISMTMGLGFAVFIDRQNGVNIPVLGQFFMMLGMLVFLSLDGHLAVIELLAESFRLLPLTGSGLSRNALGSLLEWSSQVFVVAAKIALPAVTALLIVNLSFGVMSRAAPTLNLFAIGFPVAMLLGFTVIFLSMDNLRESVSQSLDEALLFVPELLRE